MSALSLSVTIPQDPPLPCYQDIESVQEFYYGVDVAISASGQLFLQCDKYRDYHAVQTLRSGVTQVIAYSHDTGPAQVIGELAPDRFTLFGARITVTVESTFAMSHATGPMCAYSAFRYAGQEFLWRIKYDNIHHRERLRHCTLLRNDKLVASFVPGRIKFDRDVSLMGNLFLRCYAAQWPVSYNKDDEKMFAFIRYHRKDAEADMMLVSFVAVWYRILKESLDRASRHLTYS